MSFENIPHEMRVFKQFCVWRFEDLEAKKPTKMPYCVKTGRHMSVTNPETWSTFDEAVGAMAKNEWYDGIGFILTDDDPYAFIDLDDAKEDKAAFASQIKVFDEFDSFAERSPSKKGLHIIIKGKIPSGRRRSSIEIYSNARYMTMTGDIYKDAPIAERQDLLDILYQQMGTGRQAASYYMGLDDPTYADDEILETATNAANGKKFLDLWEGNWQDHYASQSEADFALVDIIAFYSENRQQICRMFRESGLGQRDKAKRNDYINYMLNRCFDNKLPPVDISGLQNQLAEAIAKSKETKLASAPSANMEIEAPETIDQTSVEFKPTKDIYTVPPGLVGEIAKFIYAQAPVPVPEIALAGALGMVAGIAGRSYNVSGTGLNQYILLLANTGHGKEAMARGIDRLFNEIAVAQPNAKQFAGPAEIASPQAALRHMSEESPSFTSVVGEFGIALQKMSRENAAPADEGLKRFLLMAYNKSGEGDIFHPSIRADKANNTKAIQAPALSILGESAPEPFYEGLHEGLITSGLLPRFTIIEYKGALGQYSDTFLQARPSFELIQKLADLCSNSLVLNGQHKCINVQFSPDAEALCKKFRETCRTRVNAADREVVRHLWTRAYVKAIKLAAVIAVGNHAYDPVITTELAMWGINIVVADVENMLDRFKNGEIGLDNDETKQLAKMINEFRNCVVSPWQKVKTYYGSKFASLHGDKIVTYGYLQRKLGCVAVYRKDRLGASNALKRTLQTLIERGDIEKISKAKLIKDYNTQCEAFMISNLKAFDL